MIRSRPKSAGFLAIPIVVIGGLILVGLGAYFLFPRHQEPRPIQQAIPNEIVPVSNSTSTAETSTAVSVSEVPELSQLISKTITSVSSSYVEFSPGDLKEGDNILDGIVVTKPKVVASASRPPELNPLYKPRPTNCGDEPCYWHPIGLEDRIEYFIFGNRLYKREHFGTAETRAGQDFTDEYSMQNLDGSWQKLFSILSQSMSSVVAHQNNLIVISSWYHASGAGKTTWSTGVQVFNGVASSSATRSASYVWTPYTTPITGQNNIIRPSLIAMGNSVLLKINLDFCFWITEKEGVVSYGAGKDAGDNLYPNGELYGACTDGYYLIGDGTLSRDPISRSLHLAEASRYQEQLIAAKENWLSPLVGRTLQYALAGETKLGWENFFSDFALLAKVFPGSSTNVKPDQIQQALQKQLTSYLGEIEWKVYENRTWKISFQHPANNNVSEMQQTFYDDSNQPLITSLVRLDITGDGYFVFIRNKDLSDGGATKVERSCGEQRFYIYAFPGRGERSQEVGDKVAATFQCK